MYAVSMYFSVYSICSAGKMHVVGKMRNNLFSAGIA